MTLTRELLEHYLRATGWRFDEPNDRWTLGPAGSAAWVGIRAALVRDAGHEVLQRLADIDGRYRHVIAFRLGLCAAAEKCAESVAYWASQAGDYVDFRDLHAKEEAERLRDWHLRAAGIEPDAWEKARRP